MNEHHAQLIAGLIAIPPADRRLIPRRRLALKLDTAATFRLAHLMAPAGFGKSSLLASWVHERQSRGLRVACKVWERMQ